MILSLFRAKSQFHLDSTRDLKRYSRTLPPNAQLQFLAESSYMRTFADTVIVYNEAEDYVLLKVSRPSNKTKEIKDIAEWREDVAKRCVYDETRHALKVISTPITIGIKKGKNSHPHPDLYKKDFYKYTMLVNGYAGMISTPGFVWVKRKLLVEIFADLELDKRHSQAYAYNDFVKYCESWQL